jgi:lysophospholipase L1-like esterase
MKAYKTLIFIAAVIFLLAILCLCFPKNGVALFGKQLFFPTLEEVFVKEKRSSASEKIKDMEAGLKMKAEQDSIKNAEISALNDSINFYRKFFREHPARFYLPQNNEKFFDSLFAALDNSHKDSTTIHILHYGDSQIEEDRITGVFRENMQAKFGGAGAGLLPVVQPIPSAAIGQSTTENIERFIIAGMHKNRAEHFRYGVLGQMATVNGSGTVSFMARNYSRTFAHTKRWSSVRLFIGRNSKNFSATLSSKFLNKKKNIEAATNSATTLVWRSDSIMSKCSITFSGNAELLGVSLDGKSGVAVDNIPLRGSSGTFFAQIDTATSIPMLKELNVKMIMLEFGGNMMPSIGSQKNIDSYMEVLAKQIEHFKNIFPQAKIVLIGPADMSKKVGGKLQTCPLLAELVEAMKQTALEKGAAFWNMFEVMGGENSMLDWVKEKPPLAAPDYIHFTPKGADKIGEILYESLLNYYNYYKLNNKK